MWAGATGVKFKLLREVDGWVYYVNILTGQEYHCLSQAFYARFFPTAS
jgi:hypothetical protein